jgi:hypothetical protein
VFYETALQTVKVAAHDLSRATELINEKPHNDIVKLNIGLLLFRGPESG